MRKQFINTMREILKSDDKSVLLLGDIGVFGFREELKNLPLRTYNIGILEQSTISIAAGIAKTGLIPFVHTIAPFMVERALEQLKIDFGYQELNGNFISIGASYDYAALGCTHHCPGDVSALSTIPNMEIVVPGTPQEFSNILYSVYNNKNPTYFRLSDFSNVTSENVIFGKANVIKHGCDATIICIGNMKDVTLKACENLDVNILYYSTVSPFDTNAIIELGNYNVIVIEPFYEGSINHHITNALQGKKFQLSNIGIPRRFLRQYGSKHEHDIALGLTENYIHQRIKKCITI